MRKNVVGHGKLFCGVAAKQPAGSGDKPVGSLLAMRHGRAVEAAEGAVLLGAPPAAAAAFIREDDLPLFFAPGGESVVEMRKIIFEARFGKGIHIEACL